MVGASKALGTVEAVGLEVAGWTFGVAAWSGARDHNGDLLPCLQVMASGPGE